MALNKTFDFMNKRLVPLIQAFRSVHTPENLGIPKYNEERARTSSQYTSDVILGRFKSRMAQQAQPEARGMLFIEDIKTLLHVADESDSETIHNLLKRYNTQKSKTEFILGPIVMRYFYVVNQPVEALKAFCDPALDGMFDYISSVKILVSLLYKHNMFEELFAVYDVIKAKNFKETDLFLNIGTVILAACYKKNTPESYKMALDLVNKNEDMLISNDHIASSRQRVTLIASIALRQNDPNTALDFLTRMDERTGILPRNLKVIAYSYLDRPEDALSTIRRPLVRDQLVKFMPEAIEALKQSLDRVKEENQKEILTTEFNSVEKELQEKNLMVDKDIEYYLERPVVRTTPRSQEQRNRKSSKKQEVESDSDSD
ncbi:pentatricopeptide repeat-containing protein 2, mitochondrial-like [Artemia franciscana]|uniref:Pentatricopeptide repeat-containing protein 2 n=1 Tax=Artemia franciscana TaxID=6661 RepID=A0AA88KVF6_ARTSF|nr:hypothetical protein QYM36_014232 [Artemia franciscana]